MWRYSRSKYAQKLGFGGEKSTSCTDFEAATAAGVGGVGGGRRGRARAAAGAAVRRARRSGGGEPRRGAVRRGDPGASGGRRWWRSGRRRPATRAGEDGRQRGRAPRARSAKGRAGLGPSRAAAGGGEVGLPLSMWRRAVGGGRIRTRPARADVVRRRRSGFFRVSDGGRKDPNGGGINRHRWS